MELTPQQKAEVTIIKKYGSLEAYKKIQAEHGKKSKGYGFKNPGQAKTAGSIGGRKRMENWHAKNTKV